MRKANLSNKLIFIILAGMFLILSLHTAKFIRGNDISLTFNSDFEMTEYSVKEGFLINSSVIDINLPSDSWNVDGVELNFTNIEFSNETKVIEDQHFGSIDARVYHKNNPFRIQGQAMQISLTEPTIIYGVEIYGWNNSSTLGTPLLQIRGYDDINMNPNNTLYSSTNLNLSSTPGWYITNFPAPILLSKGNYFLVMNGSALPSGESDLTIGFVWYYNNNSNPLNLNYSRTITTSANWDIGNTDKVLLYKLIQKINLPFNPESNNMTVEINNLTYSVSNGSGQGEGYFKNSSINFNPFSPILNIPIFNNRSANLIFNLTYKLDINNFFLAPSNVFIMANLSNLWTVSPIIIRNSNNYSVRFDFPSNWQNITILKDQVNITSSVTLDLLDNYLVLPNDTITDGAEWEIQAHSMNKQFSINAPKIEYLTGQELRFSISEPVTVGNYTLILVDPSGFEEYRSSKIISSGADIFSYVIPLNAIEGTYSAYLFFYNGTDAGIQIQEFSITKAPLGPSNNPIGLIIALIAIIGAVVGFGSYIGLRKVLSIRNENLETILNRCNDLINLEYILVLDIKSGIDLFSQSFTSKKLDTTLISGFLQAIRTFGAEMSEAAKKSRTVKLEYKKSIMLMTEFVNLRLIIIMKENPTPHFLYTVEDLAYDIYKKYGKLIDNFQGNIKQFKTIKDLVEKHLNVSFLYPLKVVQKENVKLNQTEKDMVIKALMFMRENKFEYFYSVYLLPENACTPGDYKAILELLRKGIFQPTKRGYTVF